MSPDAVTVRQARAEDEPDVAAFAADTWPDRDGSDYVPRVFGEWVETDGPDQHTLVATVPREGGDREERAVGVAQVRLLSEHEVWAQGMRVDPDFRGRGVANAIGFELFDWAREQGARVARNMVFSWNVAGLGQSRAAGYDPATEFRWVHPEPGRAFDVDPALRVTDDPGGAWAFWTDSDVREHLRGLALSAEETWALSELRPADLRRASEETALLVVEGPDGVRATAHRVREQDREVEGETEHWVEYGVGAWADLPAARALLDAVAADAAAVGADHTRVLVPETPRAVSDAAALRVEVADRPDFVMAADLTADYRES
jgi:GNAT superfamily N-acetyltransferase